MEEEEEESKFCRCCKKYVNAANFTSHSAFCQRNITICRICKEPIFRDLTEEHEAKYHISVKCDLCCTSVEKWMLSKHQEECPMLVVFCEFCRKSLSFDAFANHIEFCESHTEKCSKCSKYIMLKDKKKHSELHVYEKQICSENSGGKKDLNVLDELTDKTSKKILAYGVKPWDKISGLPGKNDSMTDDIEFANCSVSVPEKSKQECSNYTKCHLCNLHISWEEYDHHTKNCSTHLEKCPYCHVHMPAFSVQQHISSTHTFIMKDLNAQGNQSESKIGECKSLSGSAIKVKLPEKKGEIKNPCPFCDQPFFPNDMSEHVKTCLESYFQCHLCCENVLQKDRDMHLSSKCKMLQEQIPSDSYTCPLCNETLKSKDKVIHDFFKCKVLIETNEESFYSISDNEFSDNTFEETKYQHPHYTGAIMPPGTSQNYLYYPSIFNKTPHGGANVPGYYPHHQISYAMNSQQVNSTQASASAAQPTKKWFTIIDPLTGKDIYQENVNEETSTTKEEPSKHCTYHPMAKQTYNMFGFPDYLPYANTSGKSSGYGEIVPNSKLKEHAQEEFSKVPQKKRECDRSPDNLKSRAKSFEKALKSLTTSFCNERRKLIEQSENARMGTSRSEKKHCSDSNEFSNTLKARQPYKMKLSDYPIFNSEVPCSSGPSQSTSGTENSTLSSTIGSKSNNSEAKTSPEDEALWSSAVQLPRCIICTMNERNIVFQPCGHLVVCSSCANIRMIDCPVCRKRIKSKLKTYIS